VRFAYLFGAAPDRVAGLFLSNTAMKVGTDESWAARISGVTDQGLRGLAPQIMERWFSPAFRATPDAKAWETMLMRGDDAGYIGTCRVLAAADLRATSPTIACPVMLVGGSADASTPEDGNGHSWRAGRDHPRLRPHPRHRQPGRNRPPACRLPPGAGMNSKGMAIRRKVLGDAHVNRAEAAKTAFDAPFQELITEAAWAQVWARDTISLRERSMLTIALLAGLGNDHELSLHIRATANTGASEADVLEALLHVAIYAGVPRANHAMKIAKDTFAAMKDAS
jgi:3-oxoadipate enol-lactonase/4-carboxymuconolactone decarboxylase